MTEDTDRRPSGGDLRLARVETALLLAVMALQIGLATVQLYLRKVHDFGFEWADLVVRQMVL
ncbi:MAG: hypothetical protein AAFV29_27260, partial [Myxococcota bacterium]